MKGLPLYTEELIKELDEDYPERHPAITLTDREIWFRAGQRAVVRNLLARLEMMKETNTKFN